VHDGFDSITRAAERFGVGEIALDAFNAPFFEQIGSARRAYHRSDAMPSG
jgi:hypothetical protein